MEIQSLTLNVNSNATESVTKVKTCLINLLPSFNLDLLKIETLAGGYNNPITAMQYHSTDMGQNYHNVQNIAARLSPHHKEQIREELEKRINSKGVLHLRFSKRELIGGKLILSTESDSVRMKLKITHQNHKITIKKHIKELNEFLCELGIIER